MKTEVIGYLYFVFLIIAALSDRLPFFSSIRLVSSLTIDSVQTIKSTSLEDTQKEKFLLANSFNILKNSLILLGYILLLVLLGFILLLFSEFIKLLKLSVLLSSIPTLMGLVVSIISFFSYYLIKKIYVKVRL